MNIPNERYFFEIPVYICEEDAYCREREKAKQKFLENLYVKCNGISREQAPDIYPNAEYFFEYDYGGAWRYNQVIGWIRLYVLDWQIRGEIWFVKATRIRRNMRKKRYYWFGKAFELWFYDQDSSAEIYEEIYHTLEQLRDELPFKKRYIDIEASYNIGQHVDWHGLIRKTI